MTIYHPPSSRFMTHIVLICLLTLSLSCDQMEDVKPPPQTTPPTPTPSRMDRLTHFQSEIERKIQEAQEQLRSLQQNNASIIPTQLEQTRHSILKNLEILKELKQSTTQYNEIKKVVVAFGRFYDWLEKKQKENIILVKNTNSTIVICKSKLDYLNNVIDTFKKFGNDIDESILKDAQDLLKNLDEITSASQQFFEEFKKNVPTTQSVDSAADQQYFEALIERFKIKNTPTPKPNPTTENTIVNTPIPSISGTEKLITFQKENEKLGKTLQNQLKTLNDAKNSLEQNASQYYSKLIENISEMNHTDNGEARYKDVIISFGERLDASKNRISELETYIKRTQSTLTVYNETEKYIASMLSSFKDLGKDVEPSVLLIVVRDLKQLNAQAQSNQQFIKHIQQTKPQITINNRDQYFTTLVKEYESKGIGQPGETITVDLSNLPSGATKLEMVYLEPGTFMMGSPSSERNRDSDETLHQVTLTKGFYMGKYEVTNAQYRLFKPSHNSRDYKGRSLNGDNQPVVDVSWNDAVAYCEWLSQQKQEWTFRLPTEAEWEYACRAGTQTRFFWGDDPNESKIDDYAWYSGNSNSRTHDVGQKQANAWGLFDMSGNVWEWCSDWYGDYPNSDQVDPIGKQSGSIRVGRGGSWDDDPWNVRSADRGGFTPTSTGYTLGFRVVASRTQ